MGHYTGTMGTINTATLVLVHTLLGLVNTVDFEERSLGPISSPDVECGAWTRNTVLISPGTVSTITSQLVKIKKCSVFFKIYQWKEAQELEVQPNSPPGVQREEM